MTNQFNENNERIGYWEYKFIDFKLLFGASTIPVLYIGKGLYDVESNKHGYWSIYKFYENEIEVLSEKRYYL